MATIFTRIIKGEIPSVKILEDERYFAFLDINPINPGHTLVVPKLEVDSLWDASPEMLAGMLPFAQKVAKAIQAVTGCARIGVLVAGFQMPHAHINLVPIEGEGELTFSRARPAQPEALRAMGQNIREKL